EFRLHGDDKFSYVTDLEGRILLDLDKDGRMVQLQRNGALLDVSEANIELLRSESILQRRPEARMADVLQSGPDKGRTTYPSIGEVRSCVILLEFPDRPYSTAKDGDVNKLFDRLCNEEGFSDYGARGSAADYYAAVSNGKFKPTFDVYGPVKLSHNAEWYTKLADTEEECEQIINSVPAYYRDYITNHKQPRWGYALAEALEQLDDEIDFSIYDYDNNNQIDNIFFFYSGHGQADTWDKTAIWPHQSDYTAWTGSSMLLGQIYNLPRQIRDGVEFTCYATSCEINSSSKVPEEMRPCLDGIGAFCHEFGHVLGLPDLYDTNRTGVKSPGTYSIMDQGSYNDLSTCPPMFSAYEQWLCKWLDYTDVEDGNTYELNPLVGEDRNAVRLRIRRPGGSESYFTEYYVIETRGNEGWDSSLPEHGMFIWRVNFDYSIWRANEVNTRGDYNRQGKPYVEMVNSDKNSFAWPLEDQDCNYIIPEMNTLLPASLSKALNAYITRLKYDEETGKASFNYNKDLPSDFITNFQEENLEFDQTARQISLKWDEVPGMRYMLTVQRLDPTGTWKTVDGLNNTILSENQRTVRNITANQWKQEFTASVRVFDIVPGAEVSTINFIPADVVGIEDVTVEIPVIYGGKGCIVAPEGSKVYNMGGVECGTENLPAGIYVVVANGATAKVTVR
ncbi:MAG: M6 family metalloprotease domain-containing protein, partial [Muribaculaceae bacterium]|nr:M6 family metalloprotease domain-containing protein [Muribaculaceae bacterium]